jgi:hypothetical protein
MKMKKIIVLIVLAMGVFTFSGCNIIADVLNEVADKISEDADQVDSSSTQDDTRTDDSATDDTQETEIYTNSNLPQAFDVYGYTVNAPSQWEEYPGDYDYSGTEWLILGEDQYMYAYFYLYEGYTMEEEITYIEDEFLSGADIDPWESITVNGMDAVQAHYVWSTTDIEGDPNEYEGYYAIIEVDDFTMFEVEISCPVYDGLPTAADLQTMQNIIKTVH